MVKITYKTGDKVFAKVKGYPPWPAKVVGDTGKKKYNVLFYGTQETGAIKPENLSYYLKFKDSYIHKYMKRAGYEDAVKQIEEAIKKDGGDGNDAPLSTDDSQDIEASDASSVSSEKKVPKRKATSLPVDDSSIKKTPLKGKRKTIATLDSTEDNSEEPVPKKSRRESNASTASKEEDGASEKSKKSTDNGIKDGVTVKGENTEDTSKKAEAEDRNVNSEKDTENTASNDTTVDGEINKIEEEPKEDENKKEEKDKGPTETSGKTKEPVSAEIKPKVNEMMEVDEPSDSTEKSEKLTEKSVEKDEIVTEQLLNNNILYAEHVKKQPIDYTSKPVEARNDHKDDILPVKLPSGTICGVKLHKEWPLVYSNEHDRALYDERVAKSVLEIKDLLSSGEKSPTEVDLDVIPDIRMTLEDVKEITYTKDIESKKKRLDRLKKEAELVTWDSKIKNNLGLDKAMPDAALEALKEFSKLEKDLDALMCLKHPHVLDTVRRLRKYVGNVKEWDMTVEDIDTFTKMAEKIRNEAEKIYNKIKNVIQIEEEKETFWGSFMVLLGEFRTKCKDLSESEVLVLCAEPDSRQAFFDKLDQVTDSEGTNINPSNTSEPVLKEMSVQGWSEKPKTTSDS